MRAMKLRNCWRPKEKRALEACKSSGITLARDGSLHSIWNRMSGSFRLDRSVQRSRSRLSRGMPAWTNRVRPCNSELGMASKKRR